MPIFTRRRIQAMLNELAIISSTKQRDLIGRLNSKSADQVIPAEMELALLWALSQVVDIEIEPKLANSSFVPDAISKNLFEDVATVIEITTVSDGKLSNENEMRRAAKIIVDYSNQIKKGFGQNLHFQFLEERGWENGAPYRRRCISGDFTLDDNLKEIIKKWITEFDFNTKRSLRLSAENIGVEITVKDTKQHPLFNFFSSMPPHTFSLEENPLYSSLKNKLAQLRDAPHGALRCIFLVGAGSTLIERLRETDPLHQRKSGKDIIEHFLDKFSKKIDAICVFSPHKPHQLWNFSKQPSYWSFDIFTSPLFQTPIKIDKLNKIRNLLPAPNFTGSQARAIQLQGHYSPSARGWYLGTMVESSKMKLVIKTSSRAILELIAGRISYTEFENFAFGDANNIMRRALDNGMIIKSVSIENAGQDEDDDRFVFELGHDVSAAPFAETSSKNDE